MPLPLLAKGVRVLRSSPNRKSESQRFEIAERKRNPAKIAFLVGAPKTMPRPRQFPRRHPPGPLGTPPRPLLGAPPPVGGNRRFMPSFIAVFGPIWGQSM